jgi:hypothetical protein
MSSISIEIGLDYPVYAQPFYMRIDEINIIVNPGASLSAARPQTPKPA